ncbi:hypothetical protein MNBD_GAMMA23-1263 [hydrothermal vent metagenome]|uniref:Cupin type-2 domain-containing protein n=1 Tax=hydrothermal vent metagenome TaxID=652676 RepID=A0A3B1ASY4_9ZZZZ
MPTLNKLKDLEPYITKDNSRICELMHPTQHSNSKQSLAQAIVSPGQETQLHYHAATEELYHILQGNGLMTIEGEIFSVESGDTLCIPPNCSHKIKNTGNADLVFLCCCSPAYSHADTFIVSDSK